MWERGSVGIDYEKSFGSDVLLLLPGLLIKPPDAGEQRQEKQTEHEIGSGP
jgi:hypothetical protein